ncbi:MAG: signal peptidase I [Deltaproteobacteria bacterium]|nr:signal peptidase I [Deltaproteobacteria bacterium]
MAPAKSEASPAPKEKRSLREQIRGVASLVLIVACVFSARASLADHYYVPSGSMLPTVNIGDRIIVDKTAFGFRLPMMQSYLVEGSGPSRGDVVVLASPEDGTVLLKRVVGLPGDRIEVKSGQVYLEGRAVEIVQEGDRRLERLGDNAHLLDLSSGGGRDLEPTTIPSGQYLVLGDNRGSSRDGRFFGLVQRGAIMGKAIRMYRHAGEWTWLPM